MHKKQREWCESLKERFPQYFDCVRVLDIGSLDINGTNRYLFDNCHYVGVDIVSGPGVDTVCRGHEVFGDQYNVVLSTNTLEHDMFWHLTLPQMIRLTKHHGLMFFSCSYSQRQHGTREKKPKDSGTVQLQSDWSDYYRNLKVGDVCSVLKPERSFGTYMIGVTGKDLRFWGIKK